MENLQRYDAKRELLDGNRAIIILNGQCRYCLGDDDCIVAFAYPTETNNNVFAYGIECLKCGYVWHEHRGSIDDALKFLEIYHK